VNVRAAGVQSSRRQAAPEKRSWKFGLEIEIAAPIEAVWAELMNFSAYPEWNPFIRSIEGEPYSGAPESPNRAAGGRAMTFRPVVLAAIRPRVPLERQGTGSRPVRRRACVSTSGSGSTANSICAERNLQRPARAAVRSRVERSTKRGFELMNEALKARLERSPVT